jgi:hypothetical protein
MPRLNSYEEIVEHYRWGPRLKAMEELEYFAKLPSLEEAIDAVADARKENGALFNHQRHLDPSTVEGVRRVLRASREAIARTVSFDELISLLERLIRDIPGAKEMFIYDAALRLGAYLKKLPQQVYLHRGTRVGAEALGIVVAERKSIRVDELPPPFSVLTAYEIEDVLCSYKDHIARVRKQLNTMRR